MKYFLAVVIVWIRSAIITSAPATASDLMVSSCHNFGCAHWSVGDDSNGVCLACIDDDTWTLVDGACVCKPNTGTHLNRKTIKNAADLVGWQIKRARKNRPQQVMVNQDTYSSSSSSSPVIPAKTQRKKSTDSRRDNEDGKEEWQAKRNLKETLVMDCDCRKCPDGYTSNGGHPDLAICSLSSAPPLQKSEPQEPLESFEFELIFSLKSISIEERLLALEDGQELLDYASDPPGVFVDVANRIVDEWATYLSTLYFSGDKATSSTIALSQPIQAVNAYAHNLLRAKYIFRGTSSMRSDMIEQLETFASFFISNEEEEEEEQQEATRRSVVGEDQKTTCQVAHAKSSMDLCGVIAFHTSQYTLDSLDVIVMNEKNKKRDLQDTVGGRFSPAPTILPRPNRTPIPNPNKAPTGVKTYQKTWKNFDSIFRYVAKGFTQLGKSKDQFNTFIKGSKAAVDTFKNLQAELLAEKNGLLALKQVLDVKNIEGGVKVLEAEIKGVESTIAKAKNALPKGAQNGYLKNMFTKSGMNFEGKAAFFESAINWVCAGLALVDLVFTLAFDDPFSNSNIYKMEVDIYNLELQINQTVTNIFEQTTYIVNEIYNMEVALEQIQQNLDLILSEIKQTECYVSNANVDGLWTARLKPLWFKYTMGRSSLTAKTLDLLGDFTNLDELYTQQAYEEAVSWAKEVRDSAAADLDSMHIFLMGDTIPGTITLCSSAFYDKWVTQNKASAHPTDDRQYYYPITAFLSQKTTYQVNGMRMINEAFNILAIHESRLKAIDMNTTILSYLTDPSAFCGFVLANGDNKTSPLYAGLSYCLDRTDISRQIYDNTVLQVETMGQPFSFGEAGQGLRLLLGSDMLPYPSYDIANASDINNQTLITKPSTTKWLIPASLSEFDPRCDDNNVDKAYAQNCSALGKFKSCATGCGLDPHQEALWDNLGSSILGIPQNLWQIADGQVWSNLRAALTGFLHGVTNQTGISDVFLSLENPPAGSYSQPFGNMSDRVWWIVNETASVLGQDIFLDSLGSKNFLACQYYYYSGGPQDYFPSQQTFFNARCFAASNPASSSSSSSSNPQVARMTGVHCASLDFKGLYAQECQNITNAGGSCIRFDDGFAYSDCSEYCYAMQKKCQISLKSSIKAKYGTNLAPVSGYSGNASSACGWHWAYKGNPDGVREYYDPRFAACGLTIPDSNKYGVTICTGQNIERTDRNNDPLFNRDTSKLACAPDFVYPWFPSKPMYKQSNAYVNISGWTQATSASSDPYMFRLPVVDITTMKCTPSPFYNAHADAPDEPRSPRSSAGFFTPCNDLMTRAVISIIGTGYYSAPTYNDHVSLSLDKDGDTITCDVNWATNTYTTNIIITIRDGPVFDTQNPAFTGDAQLPVWTSVQKQLYDESIEPSEQTLYNISLRGSYNGTATNSLMRVIGCTAIGVDYATSLPITLYATSKVVFNISDMKANWSDFSYPIYTSPCYKQGCISTVLSNIKQPRWLTSGRAVNWKTYAGRMDTIFVIPSSPSTSLYQISPSLNASDGFQQDPIFNLTSVTVFDNQIPTGTWGGLSVDDQGALIFPGFDIDSEKVVVAKTLWNSSRGGAGGDYGRSSTFNLGETGSTSCYAFRRQADKVKFTSLVGSWRHPRTGDLYVVDGGCGLLYRMESKALNTTCLPNYGSCGLLVYMANLTETANLILRLDQNISLAGDVDQDILYLGYGKQCGIMSLNLTTGASLGWAVASTVTLNGTLTDYPLCGYNGDDAAAVGKLAMLSSDVRQLTVDPTTGDLYIADTGNFAIRMVSWETGNITTVAGVGQGGYTGDGGPASSAALWEPSGLWVSAIPDAKVSGGYRKALYIADTSNNAVRRVLLTDFVILTPAPTQRPSSLPSSPPTAPTKRPTPKPTTPTQRPTVGKPKTSSPTSKTPSPTMKRTSKPTGSPSLQPSPSQPVVNWSLDWPDSFPSFSCEPAKTLANGVSNITCTCPKSDGNGNYPEVVTSNCYDSCCPIRLLTYDRNTGLVQCNNINYSCQRNGQPCPRGWTYPEASCSNCYETFSPTGAASALSCSCQESTDSPKTATCYSTCCSSKSITRYSSDHGFICSNNGICGMGPNKNQRCPELYSGSYIQSCQNCVEIQVAGVPGIKCDCKDSTTRNLVTSSCYANCCPSGSTLSNSNGFLACDVTGKKCMEADRGPC